MQTAAAYGVHRGQTRTGATRMCHRSSTHRSHNAWQTSMWCSNVRHTLHDHSVTLAQYTLATQHAAYKATGSRMISATIILVILQYCVVKSRTLTLVLNSYRWFGMVWIPSLFFRVVFNHYILFWRFFLFFFVFFSMSQEFLEIWAEVPLNPGHSRSGLVPYKYRVICP